MNSRAYLCSDLSGNNRDEKVRRIPNIKKYDQREITKS